MNWGFRGERKKTENREERNKKKKKGKEAGEILEEDTEKQNGEHRIEFWRERKILKKKKKQENRKGNIWKD
jgi:hypothetical protein